MAAVCGPPRIPDQDLSDAIQQAIERDRSYGPGNSVRASSRSRFSADRSCVRWKPHPSRFGIPRGLVRMAEKLGHEGMETRFGADGLNSAVSASGTYE